MYVGVRSHVANDNSCQIMLVKLCTAVSSAFHANAGAKHPQVLEVRFMPKPPLVRGCLGDTVHPMIMELAPRTNIVQEVRPHRVGPEL